MRSGMLSLVFAAAAGLAAAAAPAEAGIVTFDTVNVAPDAPSVVYNVNGITMTVTGFVDPGAVPQWVRQTALGLGVVPVGGGVNSQLDYETSGLFDYLLFTFSETVHPVSIRFGEVTLGAGGDFATVTAGTFSEYFEIDTKTLFFLNANNSVYDYFLPGGSSTNSVLLKVAASVDGQAGPSRFTVQQVVVQTIPLPPAAYSGFALLAGIGLVRWMRRKPATL